MSARDGHYVLDPRCREYVDLDRDVEPIPCPKCARSRRVNRAVVSRPRSITRTPFRVGSVFAYAHSMGTHRKVMFTGNRREAIAFGWYDLAGAQLRTEWMHNPGAPGIVSAPSDLDAAKRALAKIEAAIGVFRKLGAIE